VKGAPRDPLLQVGLYHERAGRKRGTESNQVVPARETAITWQKKYMEEAGLEDDFRYESRPGKKGCLDTVGCVRRAGH